MRTKTSLNIGARARTRLAILDAAMRILSKNPSASINEIADAAGVGRSTVHRHFTERSDLIEALAQHVYMLSDQAVARADPESGPAAGALRRVVEEQLDIGLALDFIYNEQIVRKKPELFRDLKVADRLVEATIRRAERPNQAIPTEWRIRVFWTLLRLGAEFVDEGRPRHHVLNAIMETLTSGLIDHDSNESEGRDDVGFVDSGV
ncbi:TetR/AcrR family transcriptional regulator [Rhizobium lusitanum]|uniref:TetR/AcrR family transcriptional regulator n=1 Tax=Rhizobium lusitanum TaxID=293958 RepID=UPI00157195C2|nr:TetR/AcrR family transcriptional regulator [Rhizobium lusitanum]NTJ11619.1 TetR/AcrR family transcriptional regulator [Rhizobium lusitanum]